MTGGRSRAVRRVAVSAARSEPRLPHLSPLAAQGLHSVPWNLVAVTDDYRSIVLTVDMTGNYVASLVGVRVSENDDAIQLELLARLHDKASARTMQSVFKTCAVDLPIDLTWKLVRQWEASGIAARMIERII